MVLARRLADAPIWGGGLQDYEMQGDGQEAHSPLKGGAGWVKVSVRISAGLARVPTAIEPSRKIADSAQETRRQKDVAGRVSWMLLACRAIPYAPTESSMHTAVEPTICVGPDVHRSTDSARVYDYANYPTWLGAKLPGDWSRLRKPTVPCKGVFRRRVSIPLIYSFEKQNQCERQTGRVQRVGVPRYSAGIRNISSRDVRGHP